MITVGIQIAPYLGRGSGGPPPEPPSLTEQVQALFAGGVPGGMWDLTSPAALRQLSDGTVAVAVGDPIGWAQDLSGNGGHLIQSVALNRPVHAVDGASFNGTSSTLGVAVFDLSSTNKMSTCYGISQINTTAQVVWETGVSYSTLGGVYALKGVGGAMHDIVVARGQIAATAAMGIGASTSITGKKVIASTADIATPLATYRRNGVPAPDNMVGRGSGNFSSLPLFVGSRNESTLRFLGVISRLVIIGRILSPAEVGLVEAWCDEHLGVLP